eukprot:COSAG06_NODE_3150_length_5768_cov_7.694733_10_plen_56_part_00
MLCSRCVVCLRDVPNARQHVVAGVPVRNKLTESAHITDRDTHLDEPATLEPAKER